MEFLQMVGLNLDAELDSPVKKTIWAPYHSETAPKRAPNEHYVSLSTDSDGFVNALSLSKEPPPPKKAQTDHHNDLKFGMYSHLRPNRGAIEAIFDKLTQSPGMGDRKSVV